MARHTKVEKCYNKVNMAFGNKLSDDFNKMFNREVCTYFSMSTMSLVTVADDGEDFTPEQYAWIAAYSQGYMTAMDQIEE